MKHIPIRRRAALACGLAGMVLFAVGSPALAQMQSSRTTGTGGFSGSSGGSFSGSSGFGGGVSTGGFGGAVGGRTSGGSFSGGASGGGSFSGGSFSGGSFSGGSFAGGTSGGNFSGGSFSGSNSFSGGGTFGGGTNNGGTFGGGLRSGGLSSGGVSTTNLIGAYYANPLAAGMPSGNTRATFGQALFNTATSTTSTLGNLTGNTRTGNSRQLGTGGTFNGSSTGFSGGLGGLSGAAGNRTYPIYVSPAGVGVGRPQAGVATGPLRPDLQRVLLQSSSLRTPSNIQVRMDGGMVVLQGAVGDEHERQLAEALLRLEPGVGAVRNDLEVREPAPPPGPAR